LPDIILVASNSIIRNPRIWKTISSLQKKYEVSVLGWNREGISSQDINMYNAPLKLLRVKAPFGKPSLIVYYPLFWGWTLFSLFKSRPKVVHTIDFDTLLPCLLYKFTLRKKLVYDVHDRYGGYVPPKYSWLHNIIDLAEELLSKQADVLVTVSRKVQSTFRYRPKQSEIIMNLSEEYDFDKSELEHNDLTLVYTGLICKDKGLDILFEVVNGLEGVRLVLAGRIEDSQLLHEMLRLPNVRYEGLLRRNDSLKLEASSDVMVVLYDLQYRKNQLSSPNKIFEAMMCGIPLITNMEQTLVKEAGCGIIVEYDIDQVRGAVIKLRDNSYMRKTLGENGRKAFVEKYNWDFMERKLYQIYSILIKK
jgi:glycosyltransferase involved in cell wall biosynthesis